MNAAALGLALWLAAPSANHALYGEALEALEAWDLTAAAQLLDRLRGSEGDTEVLRELQGRLLFFQGDYQGAAQRLAGSDSPFASLAEATRAETASYDERQSAHFSLRFPRGKDELLAPYALETLELARERIGQDLGFVPEERIRVEILRDPSALSRLSPLTQSEIETSGTIALCKYAKLMVVSPRALVTGYGWQDTLAHELTHYLITRASNNHTPIWLHEGIAKFEESRWRGQAGAALSPSTAALLSERLAKNTLIPFEKMHPSIAKLPSQKDAALAFAEVFTTIEFLVRERHASLPKLLIALRDGQGDTQAVEVVAGEPFERMERDWRVYLGRRPMPREVLPLTPGALKFKGDLSDPRPGAAELDGAELDELEDPSARRFAHLGALLFSHERLGAAVIELRKAESRIGARSPTFSNLFARALIATGQASQARSVLEASLTPYPEVAETYVRLGVLALEEKRWADARSALLDANAIDPFDPEIHQGLAAVAKAEKDTAALAREVHAVELLSRN